MKHTYIIKTLFVATLLSLAGCNDVLEEKPKTTFTIKYFESVTGLESAIVSAYAGMRYNYGPVGAMDIAVMGTDEWTNGEQAVDAPLNVYNVTPNEGAILTPWNRNWWHINLCNAVIEIAPGVEMDETLRNRIMGEAYYLRASYYFLLVTQFGAVPLDLGSGELKFNDEPNQDFNRFPIEELFVKNYQAMISDLTNATALLPDKRPVNQFRLSKAAAYHMLAKVYLFRGYSAAQESTDFEKAYEAAMEVINNQDKYGTGLLDNFADIHKEGNDYNKEILYSVERLPLNNAANEIWSPGTDFANKANFSSNGFICNYQQAVPANYYNSTIAGKALFTSRVLQYGRPLRRFAPTKWLLEQAFNDKENDSRFDNSFRIMWPAATYYEPGTADYDTYVTLLESFNVELGDTLAYIPKTATEATYLKSLAGAAKKNYYIISPNDIFTNQNRTIHWHPNLKKFETVQRANFNDMSGRPFAVSRLAETYLLAAEAALQAGHPSDAVPLVNVIKKRAAFRTGLSAGEIDTRYNLIDVTSGDITLDFILDERARELCGESMRWADLACRGKLLDRVPTRNPDAKNLKDFHVLRPIPQSQLDLIVDTDKAKYQNPNY